MHRATVLSPLISATFLIAMLPFSIALPYVDSNGDAIETTAPTSVPIETLTSAPAPSTTMTTMVIEEPATQTSPPAETPSPAAPAEAPTTPPAEASTPSPTETSITSPAEVSSTSYIDASLRPPFKPPRQPEAQSDWSHMALRHFTGYERVCSPSSDAAAKSSQSEGPFGEEWCGYLCALYGSKSSSTYGFTDGYCDGDEDCRCTRVLVGNQGDGVRENGQAADMEE